MTKERAAPVPMPGVSTVMPVHTSFHMFCAADTRVRDHLGRGSLRTHINTSPSCSSWVKMYDPVNTQLQATSQATSPRAAAYEIQHHDIAISQALQHATGVSSARPTPTQTLHSPWQEVFALIGILFVFGVSRLCLQSRTAASGYPNAALCLLP